MPWSRFLLPLITAGLTCSRTVKCSWELGAARELNLPLWLLLWSDCLLLFLTLTFTLASITSRPSATLLNLFLALFLYKIPIYRQVFGREFKVLLAGLRVTLLIKWHSRRMSRAPFQILLFPFLSFPSSWFFACQRFCCPSRQRDLFCKPLRLSSYYPYSWFGALSLESSYLLYTSCPGCLSS